MTTPRRARLAYHARRSPLRVALGIVCLFALVAVTLGLRRSELRDSYAFGGRIIPADGGSLNGVRVVALDARGSYEALIDSSGIFVGAFPSSPRGRITLRIFSDSSDLRYHTSTITLGSGVPNRPMRVVIVPARWRIQGGSFDGREVAIDPVRATERYSDATGYWRLTKRGRYAGRAVAWVADSLPVRVAFRHERGDPAISEQDSIGFWAQATTLERMLGRSLFRPATFAEIDGGAEGILVTVTRNMSSAGKTFITYDQTGRIYEALVTVNRREYLTETRVATHELLHAIGLGHTHAWRSVMGPSTRENDEVSAEDVAYTQLYYAIAGLQREKEAPFGILESGLR